MQVICKECNRKIDTENINVANDTAYCASCGNLTSLSLLNATSLSEGFDPRQPASGIKYDDQGYEWLVEASHKSFISLFIVPFTAVWAGGSLAGIYGSQIVKGEFDLELSLFGIPFLIGSIVLISVSLMSLFGRTLVSNSNGKALVFIGVGIIGWYRRFDWSEIDRVVEAMPGRGRRITLEGNEKISFGWGLSRTKIKFIANLLRTKL